MSALLHDLAMQIDVQTLDLLILFDPQADGHVNHFENDEGG